MPGAANSWRDGGRTRAVNTREGTDGSPTLSAESRRDRGGRQRARTGGRQERNGRPAAPAARTSRTRGPVDVEGHTVVSKFTSTGSGSGAGAGGRTGAARVTWTVYEDLRTRDGAITFVGSNGESRVLTKSAEASFADEAVPPYLGISIEDIGMSGRDLLAEKLLAHGDDPDPAQVIAAAPPQGSAPQTGAARGRWVTFVGTKEAFDVTPVYPAGSTRTWLPSQYFEELRVPVPNQPNATGYQTGKGQTRYDGLVGGWMPATRTVIQLAPDTPGTYIEHVIFGDVRAEGQVHHPDLAPLDEGRSRQDRQGRVRLHLSAVSAGAQAPRSRGVLSRAAGVRGLLGRAARRSRARDAAGSIVDRPDVALLRQGADDPLRRRVAEIRRASIATTSATNTTASRTSSPARSTPTSNGDASTPRACSSTTTSRTTSSRTG